jgi:hypothetical protein
MVLVRRSHLSPPVVLVFEITSGSPWTLCLRVSKSPRKKAALSVPLFLKHRDTETQREALVRRRHLSPVGGSCSLDYKRLSVNSVPPCFQKSAQEGCLICASFFETQRHGDTERGTRSPSPPVASRWFLFFRLQAALRGLCASVFPKSAQGRLLDLCLFFET